MDTLSSVLILAYSPSMSTSCVCSTKMDLLSQIGRGCDKCQSEKHLQKAGLKIHSGFSFCIPGGNWLPSVPLKMLHVLLPSLFPSTSAWPPQNWSPLLLPHCHDPRGVEGSHSNYKSSQQTNSNLLHFPPYPNQACCRQVQSSTKKT